MKEFFAGDDLADASGFEILDDAGERVDISGWAVQAIMVFDKPANTARVAPAPITASITGDLAAGFKMNLSAPAESTAKWPVGGASAYVRVQSVAPQPILKHSGGPLRFDIKADQFDG